MFSRPIIACLHQKRLFSQSRTRRDLLFRLSCDWSDAGHIPGILAQCLGFDSKHEESVLTGRFSVAKMKIGFLKSAVRSPERCSECLVEAMAEWACVNEVWMRTEKALRTVYSDCADDNTDDGNC